MSTLHDEGVAPANCKYFKSTDMTKLKFQIRYLRVSKDRMISRTKNFHAGNKSASWHRDWHLQKLRMIVRRIFTQGSNQLAGIVTGIYKGCE